MVLRAGWCVCVVLGWLVGGSFERSGRLALGLGFGASRVCASRLLASLCVCVSCWPACSVPTSQRVRVLPAGRAV
jgi:hypothetical protein